MITRNWCRLRKATSVMPKKSGSLQGDLLERAENLAKAIVLEESIPEKVKNEIREKLRNLPEEEEALVSSRMEDAMIEAIEERLMSKAPKHTMAYSSILANPDVTAPKKLLMRVKRLYLRFKLLTHYMRETNLFLLHLVLGVACASMFYMICWNYMQKWGDDGYLQTYLNEQMVWGDVMLDYTKNRGRKLLPIEKHLRKQNDVLLAEMSPVEDYRETMLELMNQPDLKVHPYDDYQLFYISDGQRQALQRENRLGDDPVPFSSYLAENGLS